VWYGGYAGLEVDQDGPRDVVVVVGLVEEDIFAVLYAVVVGGVLFEYSRRTNAVFAAELFPELSADWVRGGVLWLPHWPIWIVIISRGIIQIKL
jgi:hypothetical protein